MIPFVPGWRSVWRGGVAVDDSRRYDVAVLLYSSR